MQKVLFSAWWDTKEAENVFSHTAGGSIYIIHIIVLLHVTLQQLLAMCENDPIIQLINAAYKFILYVYYVTLLDRHTFYVSEPPLINTL
jgi:hypothetical protein